MSIDLRAYKPTEKSKVGPSKGNSTISTLLNKEISLFGNSLSSKKKESFYSELHVLLKAGVDLKTALEIVEEEQKNKKARDLLGQIKGAVIKGKSLSLSLEATSKFSSYEVYSIRIAEETGKIVPVLKEIADYFSKNLLYKRLLISALSYPLLVIVVAVFVLMFLLSFLVPLFGDIYARLNQQLPPLTLTIIKLSNIIRTYSSAITLFIVTIVAFFYFQRKSTWFRRIWSAILINIPIIGSIIREVYLARFSQSMAFLLSSKVPLTKALQLVQKMINFYPIEFSIPGIEKEILQGETFHATLQKHKIYPQKMISLVKVGEEANQLDTMFSRLASQYTENIEQRTKLIGSLLEPILILFIALIVGVILIAMYLPIFKLVQNVGL